MYDIEHLELDSRITAIGDNTFSMLFNLKGELILPEGLVSVGENAFYSASSQLEIKEFPPSLKHIGSRVFRGCLLPETLVIPETWKFIGDCAFENCSQMKTLVLNNRTEYASTAFQGCLSLEEVQFPDGIQKLSHAMFCACGITS